MASLLPDRWRPHTPCHFYIKKERKGTRWNRSCTTNECKSKSPNTHNRTPLVLLRLRSQSMANLTGTGLNLNEFTTLPDLPGECSLPHVAGGTLSFCGSNMHARPTLPSRLKLFSNRTLTQIFCNYLPWTPFLMASPHLSLSLSPHIPVWNGATKATTSQSNRS